MNSLELLEFVESELISILNNDSKYHEQLIKQLLNQLQEE